MPQVELHYRRSRRWRKSCCLAIAQGTPNNRGGDLGNLIAVHKPQAMTGLHGDSIKEVQLWDL